MSTINKYAQYIAEQEKRNIFNSAKEYISEDKHYMDDDHGYQTGKLSNVNKEAQAADSHMGKSKYKINHTYGGSKKAVGGSVGLGDGRIRNLGKPHKNPDITLHYPGDVEHVGEHGGYTVHKDGAAANDPKLHKPAMHDLHKEQGDFK